MRCIIQAYTIFENKQDATRALIGRELFLCGLGYLGRTYVHIIQCRPPYSRWIHSDEGLTLETSVFESFTVANLPYRRCC